MANGRFLMKTHVPAVSRTVLQALPTEGDGFTWMKQARQMCQRFGFTEYTLMLRAANINYPDDKARAELEARKAYAAFCETRNTPRRKGRRRNQEPVIASFVRAFIAFLVSWKKPVQGRLALSVA